MILVVHPRSGSEWFLTGLTDIKYRGWEILSRSDYGTDHAGSIFKKIPLSTRTLMLEHRQPKIAHKIQLHELQNAAQTPYFDRILTALRKYDDVYLLHRRNMRRAAVSHWIAVYNGHIYHNNEHKLIHPVTITRKNIEFTYHRAYKLIEWSRTLFDFKEEFVYEDLVSGDQIPQTVGWDPTLSSIQRRNTADSFRHLITNYDEMVEMMDEIGLPGSL